MGLDVSSTKVVTLTSLHEHGVITSKSSGTYDFNVSTQVMVTCLFRRNPTSHNRSDGMPLMYALKGTRGHTIGLADLAQLSRRGSTLFAGKFLPGSFDLIVPVPSSAAVTKYLANRVARALGPPATVRDVFHKKTIRAVLNNARNANTVPPRDQALYKSAINLLSKANQSDYFAVKKIEVKLRKYFISIGINGAANLPHGKRVLIVDDSAQSGSSIRECADLLKTYFRPSLIHGLVIIGP